MEFGTWNLEFQLVEFGAWNLEFKKVEFGTWNLEFYHGGWGALQIYINQPHRSIKINSLIPFVYPGNKIVVDWD